ncbi:MAG: hypothetical protein EBT42_06035 [Actinobacteria bacterium]|nr:hypothetical protein [Actinomycetota bacterium]
MSREDFHSGTSGLLHVSNALSCSLVKTFGSRPVPDGVRTPVVGSVFIVPLRMCQAKYRRMAASLRVTLRFAFWLVVKKLIY